MASVKVPLKFQVYRGDALLREDVLSEAVIKVGKLASSHLRIDDDSVSRMHAVVEINGADDVQLIDLGSTRGTLVNGERVTKTRLRSGDDVMFGDIRVRVTFLDDEATVVAPGMAEAVAQTMAPPPAYAPPAYTPPAPAAPAYVPQAQTMPLQPPAPVRAAAPAFPPPPAYASPPPSAPAFGLGGGGVNPVAAEVEVHDGARAVEVQAMFRGVVVNTRHLYDGQKLGSSAQSKGLIFGGIALTLMALAIFVATSVDIGRETAAYEKHLDEGKPSKAFNYKHRSPALDFVVFGGLIAGIAASYMGLKRRGKTDPEYTIGQTADVDAVVGNEYAPGGHALVSPQGGDYVVSVTPQMRGEVVVDNQVIPLTQWVSQRGNSFPMPERGRAKIDCGEATFLVTSTPKPRTLDVPFFVWRWSEQIYTVASAGTLALFLLIIFAVPPDPKSLSLDLFNADNRFVNFLIKPPEEKEEEIPEWLKKAGPDEAGGKGQRHKGDEGKMGKKTSKNKEGLYGLKGPKDNPDPHLAKKLSEEQAKNAGILGVLKSTEGSHLASIFGRDTALGSDPENVLGGLVGNQIGEAYGVGGLGLVGTGAGGGGTGEGTIGLGNFGTIGKGGGGGSGSGYGRGAGGLGGRRARTPEVQPGTANVRGSLDKEIIRRIIRRHINEVKYCYEQELMKKPDLGGRVAVTFVITAAGSVQTSNLQSTTMGNPRVETCVVNAVRRWEFPKPLGGGIVIVTYPFSFSPAGGGAE